MTEVLMGKDRVLNRVYIASSWKLREEVRELANILRGVGYEVFDFTDSNCRKTKEIPPEKYPEEFNPARHQYSSYINKESWKQAVFENKERIENSDIVVLLLPCGNDSHADWAYGVGLGKTTFIVGQPKAGERSPSHLWSDGIFDNNFEFFHIFMKNYLALLQETPGLKPFKLNDLMYAGASEESCNFGKIKE